MYSKNIFEQAKHFFDQSMDKKMEAFTGLVPNEYVGYHPYSRSGRKKKVSLPSYFQQTCSHRTS